MTDLTTDEKNRTAWSGDRITGLMDSAQTHVLNKQPDRAIAIWQQMIAAEGDEGDWGRLEYADYLFREDRDGDAKTELAQLLAGGQSLGHPWRLTAELLEERGELECALFWYSAAVARLSTENLGEPGRLWADELRAGRRRLRWALDVPLDDADLRATIGADEHWAKERRVFWLLVEPEVVDGHLHFWSRQDSRTTHQPWSTPTAQRPEATYYQRIERTLQATDAGRIRLLSHPHDAWTHLTDHVLDARRPEDIPLLLNHADDEPIHWPPNRNQPCWCGSTAKYKRCCGAAI